LAGLFLEKKFLFLFGLCIRRRQPFIYISNIKELKFHDFFFSSIPIPTQKMEIFFRTVLIFT